MQKSHTFFKRASIFLLVLATIGILGYGGIALAGAPEPDNRDSVGGILEAVDGEQYDPDAAYRLGMGYGLGSDGLVRDDAKAFLLLRRAAQKGHIKATYALAWLYLDGRGAPVDPASAANFFTAAAQQGDAESQYMLSILYAQGRGVAKNSVVSLQWLQKASKNGHQEAQRMLSKLFQPSTTTEPPEKK